MAILITMMRIMMQVQMVGVMLMPDAEGDVRVAHDRSRKKKVMIRLAMLNVMKSLAATINVFPQVSSYLWVLLGIVCITGNARVQGLGACCIVF